MVADREERVGGGGRPRGQAGVPGVRMSGCQGESASGHLYMHLMER